MVGCAGGDQVMFGKLSEAQITSYLMTQLSGKLPTPEPWAPDNGAVVHLTLETWPSFRAEHPRSLVMFYAPWCAVCERTKPWFIELSSEIAAHEESSKVFPFGAVDCTVWFNRPLCLDQMEVKGYPTLKVP